MRIFAIRMLAALACAACVGQASAQETAAADPSAMPAIPTEIQLPVPAVTISAGEAITEGMLLDRPFAPYVAERYPIITSHTALVGKIARRMLLPGNPVPMNAVEEPKLVTRGTAAQLRFEAGGLRIVGLGMPLDSGALGAMVRLKNIDSGQVISGIVQKDGSVKVGAQ